MGNQGGISQSIASGYKKVSQVAQNMWNKVKPEEKLTKTDKINLITLGTLIALCSTLEYDLKSYQQQQNTTTNEVFLDQVNHKNISSNIQYAYTVQKGDEISMLLQNAGIPYEGNKDRLDALNPQGIQNLYPGQVVYFPGDIGSKIPGAICLEPKKDVSSTTSTLSVAAQ